MKKYTIATVAASALAALSIGLATPAIASPSTNPGNDNGNVTQDGNKVVPTVITPNPWVPAAGMTPYGTYQNDNTRQSGARR
ncbi:MAG TPA: hypothetical protein VFB19_10420 [Mycobacterium sp.]|nr:hypothetical protein [Mycobacterium sp.]